jgi:DNA-binding transcriptional MerR regulator
MEKALPAIPAKRYFTIGEVSDLCGVKPYVLRYWEQEFTQLKPMKRRGNRRYYQHHEVLLIRRIRELLYEQGFTISGARNRLTELVHSRASSSTSAVPALPDSGVDADAELEADFDASGPESEPPLHAEPEDAPIPQPVVIVDEVSMTQMREELISIRHLLVA